MEIEEPSFYEKTNHCKNTIFYQLLLQQFADSQEFRYSVPIFLYKFEVVMRCVVCGVQITYYLSYNLQLTS